MEKRVDILFCMGRLKGRLSPIRVLLCLCVSAPANRDIADLVEKRVLLVDVPDSKRPSYSINYAGVTNDLFAGITNVRVDSHNSNSYLVAAYQGKEVAELILRLDADRVTKGEISPESLVGKYFFHLVAGEE